MKEYLNKSSGTPLVFMYASICCNCVMLECRFGRFLNGPFAFQQGQKACAPRFPGRFVRAKDRVGHVLAAMVDDDFPACVHAKALCYGKGCRVHGTDKGVHLPCPKVVEGMVQKECASLRGIAPVPVPLVQDIAYLKALLAHDGLGENACLADDDVFLSLQTQGPVSVLGVWVATHALYPGKDILARKGVLPGVHDLNVSHEGAQCVEVAFLKPAQEKP